MTEIATRLFDLAKALRTIGQPAAADRLERDAIKVGRLERTMDEIAENARQDMELMDKALERGEIEAIGRKHL